MTSVELLMTLLVAYPIAWVLSLVIDPKREVYQLIPKE